jgi:hypothetical protein
MGHMPTTTKKQYFASRIIIKKRSWSNQDRLTALLKEVGRMHSNGISSQFLITPGGFIKNENKLTDWNGGHGWTLSETDSPDLFILGDGIVDKEIPRELLKAAKKVTRYISFGIDIDDYDRKFPLQAELVCLIDLKTDKRYWTGKSYPTPAQQYHLIQVSDLKTHFVELPGVGSVCILGCHDLNLLSHRSQANQSKDSPRATLTAAFHRLMRRYRPVAILQHPHTTDTSFIWNTAWGGVREDYPHVKNWVAGISYFRRKGRPRAPLDKVLEKTHQGTCYDMIPR